MTVEPGRLLAGRYRVEDLVTDRAGARSWRAVDQVLRRSVAVDILAADAPRASALVNAARRSAVVADSRFLRVLDASQENGDVYVVREWARGEPLERILADGPLTHRRAAWVAREIAEALSAAHRAGIYHWRLVPDNIIVTETGAVRIIGLATDAALQGLRYADAEAAAEDVRGLGRLLYAMLVTRWPGGSGCALPKAPSEHGRLLTPRQVRAGVPRPLDDICDRILGDPPRHHASTFRTCDEVGAALAEAAGLATDQVDPDATQIGGLTAADTGTLHPVGRRAHAGPAGAGATPSGPPPAVRPARQHTGPRPTPSAARRSGPPAGRHPAAPPPVPAETTAGDGPAAPVGVDPGGRRWSWAIISLVVLVLSGAAFLIGYTLTGGPGSPDGSSSANPDPTPQQRHAIADVQAWDPFGEDGENDEQAPLAADGDRSTAWTTMSYFNQPDFGGLKDGLGLIVDLGRPRDVSMVRVNVGGGGTDFEIRVAPGSNDAPPAAPEDFTVQGSATDATGPTAVELDREVTTRYVLVWLTKLPAADDGDFAGQVREVAVIG